MVFALGPDLRGLSTAVPPTGDPSPSHPAPAQASTRLGLWDPQGRGSAMLTVSSGQLPGQSLALKGPQRWLCWGCVWQAWGTHPKTGTPRVSWGRGRPGLTRTELSVDRGREHTWRGTPAPQHRKSPSQRLPDRSGNRSVNYCNFKVLMSVYNTLTFLQQLLWDMKISVVSFGAETVSTADTAVACPE